MTPRRRDLVVALSALFTALTMCAVLPLVDPRCGAGSAAAMLGSCGAAQAGLSRDVAIIALLLFTALVALVAALVAFEAVAHHRLSNRLRRTATPVAVGDQEIGLVPGASAAAVAGLLRPQIYCSDDVLTRLGDEELAAVLLHERHHASTHAPAKLVVLAALARLIGRTRHGRAWIASQRSQIEIAADEHAIANGATRPALARAILILAEASPTLTLAGFGSAADLRIRALLGEAPAASASPRRFLPTAVLGAAAVVVVCTILSML